MRRFPPGLLAVTDRGQARGTLEEICAAALEAGFAGVMVREKNLPAAPLLQLARPLHGLCRARGGVLVVNERLDVALALPGAGAHVGRAGIPVADARRVLGHERLLGYSAHEVDEAESALADGADYVLLAPVFPSQSKPDLVPRGEAWLAEAVQRLGAERVVALGGVDETTAGDAARAGAGGAAVMGTLMRAEDPRRVAEAIAAAWQRGGGRLA